jgi:dihydroorotate dehydrogenase
MSWLYRTLVRPLLFRQDSESIHNFTIGALGRLSRTPAACGAVAAWHNPGPLPIEVLGLDFPNPIGLAAGMDKEAAALPAWHALGFGFAELGAVTWHAQPGNPKPRVFRAISEEALVNRMGFNNAGAEAMAEHLAAWRTAGRWPAHPVGINLGKSKITPLEQAADDYARSFRVLWSHLDFFVVNVSSPNTPNLRQLQDKTALTEILQAMQEVNRKLASGSMRSQPPNEAAPAGQANSGLKPVLVKIAPDLTFEAIDEILALIGPCDIAGIVATNTTITRRETGDARSARAYAETGGLSGKPLRAKSTEIIRHVYQQTRGAVPIIGVGGVFTAADAWEKVAAGASLVQVYTGLVYEGPGMVSRIVKDLRATLATAGFTSLRDAVGSGIR